MSHSFTIVAGASVPADDYDAIANPTGSRYYKLYKVAVAGSPAKASITTICRPFSIEGGAGAGSGLPDNTGKSGGMTIQMSVNNTFGVNDPTLWTIDFERWV